MNIWKDISKERINKDNLYDYIKEKLVNIR